MISSLIHKFSYSDGEEIPDMAKTAENGQEIKTAFSISVSDTTEYEKRMIYLVNAAAKFNVI